MCLSKLLSPNINENYIFGFISLNSKNKNTLENSKAFFIVIIFFKIILWNINLKNW